MTRREWLAVGLLVFSLCCIGLMEAINAGIVDVSDEIFSVFDHPHVRVIPNPQQAW